jgi:hypothetical protein
MSKTHPPSLKRGRILHEWDDFAKDYSFPKKNEAFTFEDHTGEFCENWSLTTTKQGKAAIRVWDMGPMTFPSAANIHDLLRHDGMNVLKWSAGVRALRATVLRLWFALL